ncbi:hypothetical protein [Oryzobacter telluris]|uniref:hypothetical protein n=1 Tax=Oryzobacter telluris TaxID=3149179 RepID=UPI00370D1E09
MSGTTPPSIGPANPYTVYDQGSTHEGSPTIQEGSGWTSGAGIIDSGYGTINALCSGNWVDAALSGVALVLDAAATAADPLGSALAAGIGWVIDHLNPIKGWFEEVAGNPGGAVAQAQAWGLIAADLGPAATDWGTSAMRMEGGNEGPAVNAYLDWQATHTEAIAALQGAAEGMQQAISVAAGIVGFVHGFLRDVLAQLVGAAISWVAQAVLSFGTLIPWICGQIGTRVAALTAKCSAFVEGLVRSGSTLGDLLSALGTWGKQLLQLLDKIKANPSLHRPTPRHAAPGGPPTNVPPWSWTPPDGYTRGGRHSAPNPTFPDAVRDGVRGGVRDSPYTAATNATDGGKQTHAGHDEDG